MGKRDKLIKISVKLGTLVCLIGVGIIMGKLFYANFEKANAFFKATPVVYSSLVFIILYILANFVIWDVKDLLKPIAAVVFGAYISTLLIYIAEVINALIFFNLSKILGREFVEAKLKGKFKKFYTNLEKINFGWIFGLRMLPFVSYRILDAAFGLSKVSLKKYMVAVLLASPPRIFWIQFILASVGGFSFEKVMQYYQKNSLVTFLVFIYFVVSMIIAFKWKAKLK